jgi:UDP-N-acetylmuramyl tripeptide synthase
VTEHPEPNIENPLRRPRMHAAILAGKLAGAASRMLQRGGGTAIAGVVAERIDPRIVARLAPQARAGAIAVTGTNGKTTTSLMLSRIARAAGYDPLHNASGSNMMRGIAATYIDAASPGGRITNAARRLAILEVDEATLPAIVPAVRPRAIVFTNLFRDQLDRYGEVDHVATLWQRALTSSSPQPPPPASTASDTQPGGEVPTLILNADDPAVAHLGKATNARIIYYGINDTSVAADDIDHASDFRQCLDCGETLAYSATFYGHVGHWRCVSCGNARPAPHISARRVTLGDDVTALDIDLPDGSMRVALPLSGLYNACNALAATAGAIALGLPRDAIVAALEGFTAAFGRQERFSIDGRDVRMLLGKNPTGLNQVLRTLAARPGRKHTLFLLNDNFADGRDISWIWDADYELLQPQTERTLAAGARAEDLALRLKYAGYGADVPVERDIGRAIDAAIASTPPGGTLYVLPTYTAMLESREILAAKAGVRKFWQDGA